MNKYRILKPWILVLFTLGFVGSANATTLADVFKVAERLNSQAHNSQAKIDALTEETRKLLSEYKTVLKEIEGLRVYNRQLERQIANQESEMNTISHSIDNVTVIQRQISPLLERMIVGLEQHVALDVPFLMAERTKRVEDLRGMMERADVEVSEKFNQVYRAYQIENDYGSTMEAYDDTLTIGGAERNVDVLKVGRIALVYQTKDGEETGFWNQEAREYQTLDSSYTTPIRNGIRMARKQLSVAMLTLPIVAPEAN